MREVESFKAGMLHEPVTIWEMICRAQDIPEAEVQQEMEMFRSEVRLEWCLPRDAHK